LSSERNEDCQQRLSMKKNLLTLFFGAACLVAVPTVSPAMSHLIDMAMTLESPTPTTPANVVVYKITAVVRSGQGLLEVGLSSAGLPQGVTVSFSPASLRFTGRIPETQVAYMSIAFPDSVAVGNYQFTVTGTAQRETITITNIVSSPRTSQAAVLFIERNGNGQAVLTGAGTPGSIYQIESTPDLDNPAWTPFGSATADSVGRFTLQPPIDTTASPMRFFRVASPALQPAPAAASTDS
jgi:hypothetical protein